MREPNVIDWRREVVNCGARSEASAITARMLQSTRNPITCLLIPLASAVRSERRSQRLCFRFAGHGIELIDPSTTTEERIVCVECIVRLNQRRCPGECRPDGMPIDMVFEHPGIARETL